MKWTSGDRGNIEDCAGQLRRHGDARRRARARRPAAGRWSSAGRPASISFRCLAAAVSVHRRLPTSSRAARPPDIRGRGEGGRHGRRGHGRRAVDVAADPGRPVSADDRGAVPRCVSVRLRVRAVGDRAVLLPCGPQGLPRPRVLRRAAEPLRRARRFRAGLRDRARARTPRAVADGHRRAGAARAIRASRSAERAVGGAGAAGRLLRRRLGPPAPRREAGAAA